MMADRSRDRARRVVIVGGGIAAIESVLALHDLAGDRVSITLIAPEAAFSLRPLTVAGPFGHGPVGEIALADLIDEHGNQFRQDTVETVEPQTRRVRCAGGDEVPYDALILAPGTVSAPQLHSGLTFSPESPGGVAAIAQAIQLDWARSVAFVVPPGHTWPLPLYELAFLTAAEVGTLAQASLHLVSPEKRPLDVFGAASSTEIAERLRRAGIAFHGGGQARLVGRGELEIGSVMPLRVDKVVSIPALRGPSLDGVPVDADGFILIDRWARVGDFEHVWAAGDCTDQPIKQGGLACQHADSIAAQIAARAGAHVTAAPPELVLRGRLFAGNDDLYLQRTVGRNDSQASTVPLWESESKVVSRYLAPYLASKGITGRRHAPPPPDTARA